MKLIKRFKNHEIYSLVKKLKPNPFKIGYLELNRLRNYPRRVPTKTKIINREIQITDSHWYLLNYKEIFDDEIYKFYSNKLDPYIIDCGSNIGLSIIYFKFLFPKAKIIGFEPDPDIFSAMEQNILQFNLKDVELHQKALWSSATSLLFQKDGSLGGRIVDNWKDKNSVEVETVRLRDFLDRPIDFLKIDIEGAEYEVLMDCKDALNLVENLFIEYHGRLNDPQSLHIILELLQKSGFRYHIKEANPIKYPFITKGQNLYYDLQLNIFAYRMLIS